MTPAERRRERNRLYNIEYRKRHREKVMAANAAWQAANPDCNLAQSGIHRAKRFGCPTVEGGTPEFERIKSVYREARELTEKTLSADEHLAKTIQERSVRRGASAP